MIYAWRDRNVHFIFKWALYSFTRACAITSSKSKEKSKNNAQNMRFEDLWLSEKLDHQNSCLIKNLRSSARAEKNQSHASRSDKNYFLFVDFQIWFCESKKRIDNDDENLREEFERDDQTLQQKRHKTIKKQNIHSNRRENEHDDQSHEKKIMKIREHQLFIEESNSDFLTFSQWEHQALRSQEEERDVSLSTFSMNQIVWCRNQNAVENLRSFDALCQNQNFRSSWRSQHNDRNMTIAT